MCGRFSLRTSAEDLIKHFKLTRGFCMVPRYNIAPTQVIPVVRVAGEMDFLKWGFVAEWKSQKISTALINARAETVSQKPLFRSAFQKRRCLVAADGYYEWKSSGTLKQPYYIDRQDGAPFAFGAIWEADTCAILTIEAPAPFAQRFSDLVFPSLDLQGSHLGVKAWQALGHIACGKTQSYSGLARALGNPKASRAIGRIMGQNPIVLLVPCHRVIGANGTLTGYGGGIERKQWLLEHEGLELL